MAKVLNIQSLVAPEERQIKIGGNTHAMKEITVGEFIELSDLAEKFDNSPAEKKTMPEQVKFLRHAAKITFPTCSEEDLDGLTISQLYALVEFARTGNMPKETIVEGEEEKKAQS
jgi:hypothetical protein